MFTLIFPDGDQHTLSAEQAARLLNTDSYTLHRWPDHAQMAAETYVIVTPPGADWRQLLADAGHTVNERRKGANLIDHA